MPDKIYHSIGYQNANKPMEYVLSTPKPNRLRQIVRQNWDLSAFKKNPIALYQHDPDRPIGTWSGVAVRNGNLTGTLKLAEKGTSNLVDTVHALVEQNILKAVSVGFTVKNSRMTDDGEHIELIGPRLFEASLVSVPANADTLRIVNSFDLSAEDRSFLLPDIETDNLKALQNRLRFLKLSARKHG